MFGRVSIGFGLFSLILLVIELNLYAKNLWGRDNYETRMKVVYAIHIYIFRVIVHGLANVILGILFTFDLDQITI